MSERAIEELIGWTPLDERDAYQDAGFCYVEKATHTPHRYATVDDLAAWLDKRLDSTWWSLHRNDDDWHVYYDGKTAPANGPTILAALTAAVRKVTSDE